MVQAHCKGYTDHHQYCYNQKKKVVVINDNVDKTYGFSKPSLWHRTIAKGQTDQTIIIY